MLAKRGCAVLSLVTCALSLGYPCALAQGYPSRPIRIVVPFPPGGASDVTARMLADKFASSWGANVVVDNRTGASGIIGTDIVGSNPKEARAFVMAELDKWAKTVKAAGIKSGQ